MLDVGPSTASNHNAGWLGFGPDGYLYIDSGEVGVPANAQDLTNQLGKILRIDVSSGAGYTIPADNPFVGDGGGVREEIFAYGLRNPWRSSFNSATGTLFIGDVGSSQFEEVNIGQSGANYGWAIAEGTSANPAFVNPIHTYPHGASASITGGYVYRGETDGLNGQYFFADFPTGRVFTLRFDGSNWVATERTSQITTDAGTIELAGLLRRGCARQSLCRRHRRRDLSIDANRRVVRRQRHAARLCGQRPAVRRQRRRPARRRHRRGLPQRRRR